MKSRETAAIIWVALLGVTVALLLGLHQTLHGFFALKLFAGEEESVHGRSHSNRQNHLIGQRRGLLAVDPNSLSAITGRNLEANQSAKRFVKGNECRWLGWGAAKNVGCAVTEKGGRCRMDGGRHSRIPYD